MRSRHVLAPVVLWAITVLPAQGHVNRSLLQAPADGAASKSPAAAVVAKVRAAVVYVFVEVDGPRGRFAIERASSGVVVDPSGLVVTWRQLVREAEGADDKQLFVQLDDAGNTRLPATVEQVDDATGLALLRVQPPAGGLPYVELGADRPRPGEPVVCVARPEGKDMLAFGGAASPALAGVTLDGHALAAGDVFLTDSRNDERCDGAPVLDGDGRLLGIYDAEHVQRDKSEPTLEDLKRPSFGVVLSSGAIRAAFAAAFAGARNGTLAKAPPAPASAMADAVRRVAPAVVSVWCGGGDWPPLGADDPGAVQRRDGLGSGVVLSKRGLVVCNLHVTTAGEPRIRTQEGRTFPATVVKSNAASNLALLQVELPAGTTLAAADCNPDDDAILGETVLAVGNPLGTQVVVAAGVVSARRDREGGRIQADANLGNANGGGAIVDVTGRVLGIGDAGLIDPLDMQYAMRGDKVTTETNLSTFLGIARVRKLFAGQIEAGADADEPIRAPAPVGAADLARRENALTAMVRQASGAMLNVYVAVNTAKVDEDDPFASMKEPELVTLGLGSGVIIDRSGLALSNWHVVDEATNPDGSMKADHAVTVRVFGGKTYQVKVLSISREDDLSLLQLQLDPGEEVHAIDLGSSDELAIGENVAAIGNPHGRANTITYGVVSAKDQGIRVNGRWAKLEHVIETDAAINGGNSGGALLDMNGRLVGINSAGGGTFNNKGYAIAVDHVRRQVVSLLFAAYKLRSPDLGMRVIDDAGRVLVMDVDGRGPAAKAGLQSGDRIVELAGTEITWSPGFALTLLRQPANVELELKVERKGQPMTFRVAPLPAVNWALVKMAGLACRDFGYAEDPDAVREAAIAMHRQISGDAASAPNRIPASVVVVDGVFAHEQPEGTDLQAGDFVLACELKRGDNGAPVFVPIDDVGKLRDLFNDRDLGSYDGTDWRLWVARKGKVHAVDVRARRLFW
ncbi:MAG: trypsin-like peptidase domain-containing protein [Planctomycetes bacterium]|nr:trypsin-like peptidase domain-containing protein [Planctomycetota bacterium]